MATMSISFTPNALSRPKIKTSQAKKLSQKKLPRNPNLKIKPLKPLQKKAAVGIEATTYARLPPRDENLIPVPSLDPLFREIKLADSPLPQMGLEDGGNSNQFGGRLVKSGKGDKVVGSDYKFSKEKVEVYDELIDFDEEDDDFGGEEAAEEEYVNGGGEFEGFDHGTEAFGDEFEGDGSEEKGEKEKGVPAIMRCFDEAKIYVKAGDGGDGVVAMRREKFIPYGGPSGGDGGRGGNVYLEVEPSLNSLLSFRKNIHFRAGDGKNGQGSNQRGAHGEDMVVKVAPGTIIREAGKDGVQGEVLFELLHPGQRALLLPGGKGGRGNASFKSGNNRVPRIAEDGEEGAEMWLELELKLVADVGIVGAPNAGKSTLLSAISLATPKIANYPFTTLLPNLGVVGFDYTSTMVVADLPGLLEGAHRGFGLGHEFLRHSERCSVLVHVVDGSSPQPEYEYDAVRLELELFNPELAVKPFLVVYNKMDLLDASDRWEDFKEKLQSKGIEPLCMSALTKEGTYAVSCAAYKLVKENMEETFENREVSTEDVNLNHVAEMIEKRRKASIKEYEITYESSSRTWQVYGSGLERFMQMTNWRYVDSERRFQHVLEACGVNRALINRGIKEGDNVSVGGMEWVWHDTPDQGGPSSVRKKSPGADRWAEWQ